MESIDVEMTMHDRDVKNVNSTIRALVSSDVGVGIISDTLNSFNDLYHNEAIIFFLLCKRKNCVNRAWKSIRSKGGTHYPNKFFIGIDTDSGPIMRVLSMDDYDIFDSIRSLDIALYDAPQAYTAEKIAAL